jgi:hypothetical protein
VREWIAAHARVCAWKTELSGRACDEENAAIIFAGFARTQHRQLQLNELEKIIRKFIAKVVEGCRNLNE